MIDITRYARLRSKAVASVEVKGDQYFLCFKRFNPETGSELEQPELQTFTVESLDERQQEIERELKAIELIKKDLADTLEV